ncbi:hypothetical protein OEB99_07090 [Actinotalea sp. M2MS4P-6]|uniref:hypothetical protein n=1 Tax=Actinotalea sp. M2MS4P-6 TaxID=2983762 RepID=UPI0021E3EB12|nr:hypothetical protein [Actinotalea sp. M2MS4P-6]MCV2394066.1 hypothetical protein [Actinotalea sp. M2MS4P-6]
MKRRTALVLALVPLLGACAAPLPVPEPEAVPAVAPAALESVQVDRVLTDLHAVLDDADAAGVAAAGAEDPGAARTAAVDTLGARAYGPAEQIRQAQYLLAATTGADALTTIPSGAQTVVDPATTTWPRVLMVVTDPSEDLQAPLLLTLVQEDPRSAYKLWAWERLFGGVELPATTLPGVGSDPVPADGGTATLTPEETIDQYVDVIAHGTESEYFDGFTDTPLQQRIAEQRSAWSAAVGQGTFTETYQPLDTGPWALATADGGAIVVGGFGGLTTLTLADSTLKVADPATTTLLGKDTITKNLNLAWTVTVAFSVPPAGSTDPVTVLGAEYALVAASGE